MEKIKTFKQHLKEKIEAANKEINNKNPEVVTAVDSRSGKTLYKFALNGDKYTATSNVQNIDNDEVKQLEDITGKTYTIDTLKTFLDAVKAKFAFINVKQKL